MWRGVMLMGFLKRLPELVSDRQGQLSTTDTTTLFALIVSSAVVLMCAYWDHAPVDALAVYVGAWVAHAGVQKFHEGRTDKPPPGGPLHEGKPDVHGTD
ncbi:hypothetical protein PRCB_03000 [Pantoea rodasii]|uniref:Uncharacterized protein n=1 Tax=Pantoea rodasii TaxID=1076549 RepID=A0A2M9WHK9_9GAMM|nr:DUF2644 domain-containing protein [Pantoea rodasii]ORM62010.1 hypothetical protein HA45_19460 [Pantoea rodasii]PJZ06996.1 hypothetical protein PRCB_03000 [Pantoea rodasii]